MFRISTHYFTILLLIICCACNGKKEKSKTEQTQDKIPSEIDSTQPSAKNIADDSTTEEEPFLLTEDNAIPFFFEYEKEHKESKVRVTTEFGSFVIQLYKETPYHRANFIYLTKKGYFNNTYFHRVVKNFIIQGGNSDNIETVEKRRNIGHYLLPPDTRKGFKHDRGTVSMPSSDDVTNPHKLASPFEFFIVVTKPGSYHLDGSYTAFGKVIEGMDVVDKINAVPIDQGEWPMTNVPMQIEIIE